MTRSAIKYTFSTPEGDTIELVGKVNLPSMVKKGYKLVDTAMTLFYMSDDKFFEVAEQVPSTMSIAEFKKAHNIKGE